MQLEQDRIDSLVAETEERELTEVKAWLRSKGTTQWVNWCIDSDDELSQAACWFLLQVCQFKKFRVEEAFRRTAGDVNEDEVFEVLDDIYCEIVFGQSDRDEQPRTHSWDGPDMFTYQPGLRPPNGLEA